MLNLPGVNGDKIDEDTSKPKNDKIDTLEDEVLKHTNDAKETLEVRFQDNLFVTEHDDVQIGFELESND